MSEPLSDERLAAIRQRAEAATAGPWEQPAYPVGDMVYRLVDRSPDGLIASCEHPTDADFIARAREDVPALLADLDRLRAENDRLATANRTIQAYHLSAIDVAYQARAQVAAMRPIVQAVATHAMLEMFRSDEGREMDRSMLVFLGYTAASEWQIQARTLLAKEGEA